MAASVKVPEFVPKTGVKIATTDEEAQNDGSDSMDDDEVRKIAKEVTTPVKMVSLDFEKVGVYVRTYVCMYVWLCADMYIRMCLCGECVDASTVTPLSSATPIIRHSLQFDYLMRYSHHTKVC